MNLRVKIVLSIIVSLLLLISMAGFSQVVPSPPYKEGITGRVIASSPETTKDIASWIPVTNALLTLTDIEGDIHIVTTDKDGYYIFTNVAVDAKCVITAIAIVNGKTMVFKDIIPQPVAADEFYDAGTIDAESTALALIVEELTKQGLTYEDINLEIIQDSENFKIVKEQVLYVLEDNGNVMDDIIVAGEEVASGEASDFTVTDEQGMTMTYKVTVTILEKRSIAETRDTYTITASVVGNGTIDPSGAVTVNYGASQSFIITPDPNYHILGITVDGNLDVGPFGSPYTYPFTNVTDDHTIEAYFAIDNYAIDVIVGDNGSISSSGAVTVDHDSSQTFIITPDSNYHIDDVLVDGSSEGAVDYYTFNNVTRDHIISATFVMDTYTITASAGDNGSISPSGDQTVDHDSSKSFTITPDYNYHIDDVLVNGISEGAVDYYSFNNVTRDHIISATFAIDTYTITASADSNGSIDPSGAVTVEHGSSKSFNITPDTNYHIDDILVDGSSVGAVSSYTFTDVTAGHTITATFAIDTYTITASADSNGSIDPSGAVTVEHGSSKSFNITPDTNYHIDDILVDGSSVGAVSSYTFTDVTAGHTITATFAIDTYTITASTGANGSIDPSGAVSVDHDSSKTFIITPDPNYHIDDVLVDGSSVGAVSSYTFTDVTAGHTITATFAIDTYIITASTGANGSISSSGAVTVEHGSSKSFNITPDTNYHIDDVLVDGSSVGAVSSYTFTDVTAGHTITATFAIDTYIITASTGANGSIDPSGAVTVEHGSSKSFNITPDTNYHIDDVLVDGSSVGAVSSYTFTDVTAGHTITATFAIDTYIITASTGANGSIDPSGAVTVNHDSSEDFTITADNGYHISSITVDSGTPDVGPFDSPYTYTFSNVTADHIISATFEVAVCVPDHFTFDIIDFSVTGEKVKGLPAKNKPFGITIYAKDASENTVTGYNGTGTLTLIDGSGDTITHDTKVVIEISGTNEITTVDFIDGVWVDNVTIGESSAMLLGLAKGDPNAFVSIKITTDNGTTGVSNYFIVTD